MTWADVVRRVRAVEARLAGYDTVPTTAFFGTARYQARTFGTAESVLALDALIAEVDRIRHDHRLDLIDSAIFINRACYPSHVQDAGAIAGLLVEAHFCHDRDQHGPDAAWRRQRSRTDLESAVAARLGVVR